MIIGVTGTIASGKDTVAEYIEGKGFIHFSLSSILREFADERHIQKTRDSLREFSDDLVEEKGNDCLVGRVLEYIEKDTLKDYLISSIRRVVEIEKLKELPDFFLIAVDADPKLRYERSLKRGREQETNYTFEEFLQKEKAERFGIGSQNLDECKSLADYVVLNNQTLKELYAKIDQVLKEKGWKKTQPKTKKSKK